MKIDKVIGIDLGTTNSCVGIMNRMDSEVILFKNKLGVSTTPSCVCYNPKKKKIEVGKLAFKRRGTLPEPVVSIKRKMGTLLLTPLGKANEIPENIPEFIRKILTESAEERLERYLSEMKDNNPEKLEENRAKARENPPLLWVYDQKRRIEDYLEKITDEKTRKQKEEDPPLLWLPSEISALILAEEKRQIEEYLQKEDKKNEYLINRAVVTVPAYFGSSQVEDTREAGAMAGLKVVEILQEPTAAAIYYCWKYNMKDGIFLVFDLGGGTFDVSIMRRTAGLYEPLGISGNNKLGGDDMDFALGKWIKEVVAEDDPDYELDLDLKNEEDRLIMNCFTVEAEGVKKSLTTEGETWIKNDRIKDKEGEKICIEMIVTRDTFEDLIDNLVEQCMPKCWEAAAKARKKAGISMKDIDGIFLVGGSTHVPLVQKKVKERLCKGGLPYSPEQIDRIVNEIRGDDPDDTEILQEYVREMLENNEKTKCEEPLKKDPDLVVAMGAAIEATNYGVITKDEAHKVMIHYDGVMGTNRKTVTIKGSVIPEKEDLDLEGAVVKLTNEEMELDTDTTLDSKMRFMFKRVSLQKRALNRFHIIVLSSSGDQLGCVDIVIEQSENYESRTPPPVSLSKAITLDVQDKRGQKMSKVLIKSGETLPARETYTLRVPKHNTGIVKFRIHQANTMLKEIIAFIDPTLSQEPIEFSFSISEDHFMSCVYRIGKGGEEVSAVIEPPPPPKPPAPEDIEKIERKIRDEMSYKGETERRKLEQRMRRIKKKMEQGIAQGDDALLIEQFEELKGLQSTVEQVKSSLNPPWEEFEALVSECRRIVQYLEVRKPDYPVDNVRKGIDTKRNAARNAYDSRNQQLYTEYKETIDATYQALLKEVRKLEGEEDRKPDPVEQARQLISLLDEECMKVETLAENFSAQFRARSSNPPEGETEEMNLRHKNQCDQCSQEVAGLKAHVEKLKSIYTDDPQKAISECRSIMHSIERWKGVLKTKQEILRGRVDDPGVLPEE